MMTDSPEPAGKEQQLLRHARREGLVIMAAWVLALAWSVGYSRLFGYADSDRASHDLHLILGMPAWVFWGIVVPWAVCLLISVWFCFRFMTDDDLGRDPDEGAGHV
jgi:Protein of unknown function (DUF997)